jgi:copper chaperone CopZ
LATTTTTYTVTGMTGRHRASPVSAEVGALLGVSEVNADLATGAVTVTSAGPLETSAVRAAVREAGYELPAA